MSRRPVIHGGTLAKDRLAAFGQVRRDLTVTLEEGESQRDPGAEVLK